MDSLSKIFPETYGRVSEAAIPGVANLSSARESLKVKKKEKQRNKHKSANLEAWPRKVATTE